MRTSSLVEMNGPIKNEPLLYSGQKNMGVLTMKLMDYLRRLLYQQSMKQDKEDKLMNRPFWGGFYDRSNVEKELFTKKDK